MSRGRKPKEKAPAPKKRGPKKKLEDVEPIPSADVDVDADADEDEDEGTPAQWDERFSEWIGGLEDVDKVVSIYAYSIEKVSGNQERRVQEMVWKIPMGVEPPDAHEMGIVLGGGDFDLIARAGGRNMLQRRIHLGTGYNDLRAAWRAQEAARHTPPTAMQGAAPASPAAADPFASLERLAKVVGPYLSFLNPMNGVNAMAKMGEQMAQRSFDQSMRVTKQAADKVMETIQTFGGGDDGDDDDEAKPGQPAAAQHGGNQKVNWEEKLSMLADIVIEKGESFLSAGPAKKAYMKKKILNDDDFQEMLGDPSRAAKTLNRLYAMAENEMPGRGRKMVNEIMRELGIQTPQPMNGAARPQPQTKTSTKGKR